MGQSQSSTDQEEINWDEGDYFDASFPIGKSIRYHTKMYAWYQGILNYILVVNALAGTSAFVAIFNKDHIEIVKYLTGLIAAASTLETVLGFSKKAKIHSDLSQRFSQIAINIAEMKPNANNLRKIRADRLRIEQKEPPVKRLIDIQARNEELAGRGCDPKQKIDLSWSQRTFGYAFTFGISRLERERDKRFSERLSNG